MFRSPLLVGLLAFCLSSPPVHAVDSSTDLAQQRFREAIQAYREKRYSAAASLFEAADRLTPHASTRFNAAMAWEDAGETARAATGYEAVLAMDSLDEASLRTARERLDALRQTLARVRIRQPLGALVTVDHIQRAPVPTVFYLRPGPYELQVEYRGSTSTNSAELGAGEDRDLELHLPFAALPRETIAPEVVLPPPPPPEPPPPIDDSDSQKTWGWVGVGAGVALSGAAIILGVRALSARDRFNASNHTDSSAHDEASDLRFATNVLWGGAAATSAAGLVLLLTAPSIEF
jgi:tetratricopeptide (TPR) repeat protein